MGQSQGAGAGSRRSIDPIAVELIQRELEEALSREATAASPSASELYRIMGPADQEVVIVSRQEIGEYLNRKLG